MQCSQVLPTRPQLVHLESVACLCESRRGGTLMKLQPKPQQASRNFIFAFAAGGTSMCNCNGHCHRKCNSNNFNCNKCNWHCECNKVSATGYDLPFKARKWNLVSHFSLLFGFCTNAPFFAFCVWSVSQSNCNVFRYLPLVSEPIGKAVDTYTITQEVAGQIAKSNWIEKLTCKQKKYVKRSIKRINLLCMRQINVSRH